MRRKSKIVKRQEGGKLEISTEMSELNIQGKAVSCRT
jgi:hypothetical protein